MLRKKIDDRIQVLLKNSSKSNTRSMFIIVGDKARDQVVNLHNLHSKLSPGEKLNVLWCYKKELGFSNHAKKKMKKIKKQMNKGVFELNDENAFDLFISSTEIKFCYYSETQRVLGNTYGMLVLQDFEAMTPNLLCRTIETVKGNGIIIILLSNMTSLKQLYSVTMDVHEKFKTDLNRDIVPRFNERFIRSLCDCSSCLCVDDELNLLPITEKMKSMKTNFDEEVEDNKGDVLASKREKELTELKSAMKNKNTIGDLVAQCKTLDQAKCIMMMVDAISEKNPKTVVSITSARGRGKSSAMGLAVASAISYGYSNIIVTAPSPENLKTFFEFVIKGLNCLGFTEHKDYVLTEGVGEFKGNIVSINVFKNHKQTIRYVQPNDVLIFQTGEIVVIDEAAAIPLHIVKRIIPDALTFMASTVMGYEGTGRSLSLKLINSFRSNTKDGKVLKELKLEEAIRYADNDGVESWLNNLLLLDATEAVDFDESLVDPKKLELYLVNRDTLFSYRKASEAFLRKIMSLFVSSHYKNSPNDLQLLSDAPAHSIFVLCRKIDKESKSLPDVYCAIQVCEEGGISKDVITTNNKRGLKPSGDLIPWTLGEYYCDSEFPRMVGVRVVRIAVHPDYTKMGYGSRALQLLRTYYEGKFINLDVMEEESEEKKMKPLLSKLTDVKPNFVYYLGTSFGLTKGLFGFWTKNGYKPLYVKMTPNDITGEHSCIMVLPIKNGDVSVEDDSNKDKSIIKWFSPYSSDFKHRFISLLSFDFRSIEIKLALSLLEPKLTTTTAEENEHQNFDSESGNVIKTTKEIEMFITKYDFKRLEKYSKNLSNYTMIIDLIPTLAKLFFNNMINVSLSFIQAGVLLGIGLQNKSFDTVREEFEIEMNQLLAMFNKMMKKFTSSIRALYENEFGEKPTEKDDNGFKDKNILEEMNEELKSEREKIKEKEKSDKKKYMEQKFKKMEDKALTKKRKRSEEKLNN